MTELLDAKGDDKSSIDVTASERNPGPVEADARDLLEAARERRAEAAEDKAAEDKAAEDKAAEDEAADEADEEGEGEGEGEGEDEGEEREVKGFLNHRLNEDGSVDLLVQWAGEPDSAATYEAEGELQEGAAETVYAYWKAKGGRSESLFYNAKPEVPEVYHVFKILRHEKKGTIFLFEVQWVGYPPSAGNTTMEPEAKLKKTAPQLLDEYWESKGGRAKFLAKRGRGRKARDD